jgi:outer membrane lipoprotein carrier protein
MVSLSGSADARPIAPLEGLEALRKAFSGITDFSAEINQEKRLTLMKRTMTMSGIVRFRKPDLFYLEIGPPYSSRMLLRDGTIEQAMGNSPDRSRIFLPPEQGLKRWFSRFSTPFTALPEGMGVTADLTGQLYTVSISPSGKGQIKELTLVFHADGTIKKLIIAEQNGDRSTMTFLKVRRNTGLTDSDFKLN